MSQVLELCAASCWMRQADAGRARFYRYCDRLGCVSMLHPCAWCYNQLPFMCACRQLHTVPLLWWHALQEAARQCITAKMKTHWGGAEQTFGALEQALQRVLVQVHARGKVPPSALHQGRCLLEFLFALEQGIVSATQGSASRAAPVKAACTFFSGNSKVCSDWFARIRPLALEAAGATGLDHLVAFHGMQRLHDLHVRAKALLPRRLPKEGQPAETAAASAGHPALAVLAPGKVLLQKLEPAGAMQSPAAALLAVTQTNGAPSGEVASAGVDSTLPKQRASNQREVLQVAAMDVCVQVAGALQRLGSDMELAGLQAFCHQAFGHLQADGEAGSRNASSFAWLEGMRLQAGGRYEDSIALLQQLSADSAAQAAVAGWTADAYTAVCDWDGLQAWVQVSRYGRHSFSASCLIIQVYGSISVAYTFAL